MTQEEVIELARQAGARDDEHIFEFSQYKYLDRFAKLIAEKERERILNVIGDNQCECRCSEVVRRQA